jgi:uncharacterized protein YcbX
MPEVSELYIYPIKSLGGIPLLSSRVTDRGFEFDRRWMLVDSNNCFLTQREFPQMALLQVKLSGACLTVQHKINKKETANVPLSIESGDTVTVEVWSDQCEAILVSRELDEWFSDMLSLNCRLVYMPDSTKRAVDTRYASNQEITNLSDGYPFLIIGQSSLDDLNARLQQPLPVNRFRPNIVFTGGEPFLEDAMKHFSINGLEFFGVKKCARCVITTVNQDDGIKSKEPLKTLSTYRQVENNIYFGQNLLHKGEGTIAVGDPIIIHHLAKMN